jgi:hypothetical protein
VRLIGVGAATEKVRFVRLADLGAVRSERQIPAPRCSEVPCLKGFGSFLTLSSMRVIRTPWLESICAVGEVEVWVVVVIIPPN